MSSSNKYDVFICHASEDKLEVARPLAEALQQEGLRVWYDDFTLRLGDSLRRAIERGLKQSRYGIVILSRNFFRKKWPQNELDALLGKETARRRVIIPIWHKVDRRYVEARSPILAERFAVSTARGIGYVAQRVFIETRGGWGGKPVAAGGAVPSPSRDAPSRRDLMDNRVLMLNGDVSNYVTMKKAGPYHDLSECPLFLPDFVSPPEFGNTRGAMRLESELMAEITHLEFKQKADTVGRTLDSLGNYLSASSFFWSISDEGVMRCGCGTNTLVRALEDGAYGMIYLATFGEVFGAPNDRTYLLVMHGYNKFKDEGGSWVKDPGITLFLSSTPTDQTWVNSIMEPFVERSLFGSSSYELSQPQSREWLPSSDAQPSPILGVIGQYKPAGYDFTEVAGIVTTNEWFADEKYELFRDWHRGIDIGKKVFPSDPIWGDSDDMSCPLRYLEKSIISMPSDTYLLEDLKSQKFRGFLLPHIRTFEAGISGADLYVFGIEGPAILNES